MWRSHVLNEIRTLDPARDHKRIVFLSCRHDFPFDTTRALEFALFRTFASPSVSALLDRTAQFQRRAQKRYDDTDIIVSEVMEHGYDSDRGRRAIKRMNQLHGRFDIPNTDLLYVLSTFVFEPIRWNERFGWRRMIDAERLAMFHFWREVGRRMGIRDIPETYDEFERFNVEYEGKHFRFADSNARVATATLEMFAAWFPRVTRPLVRRTMYALMGDELIRSFDFPQPSAAMRMLAAGALKTRALAVRLLCPKRRRPLLRTGMTHRSYPSRYDIESLGPDISARTDAL